MRYLLKFNKEGYIIYTSHLDIMRLFKRSFKRVGIKLTFSQGFHPHPKMSFAQPLSLGYSGIGEYLEFETETPLEKEEIVKKLNEIMPVGLVLTGCDSLPNTGKTMAAMVNKASYHITIPMELDQPIDLLLTNFLNQETIEVTKFQKKSGKETIQEIKEMILDLKGEYYDKKIMLTTTLCAGSVKNVSPELLLQALFKFLQREIRREEIKIERISIDFQ
ncbi:MAG: TIGR03936 family radical SAM-associated protein [Anaerovorax sp.]